MIIDTDYIKAGIQAIKKSDITISKLAKKYHLNANYFYQKQINPRTSLKTLDNLMKCVADCEKQKIINLNAKSYLTKQRQEYQKQVKINSLISSMNEKYHK